MCETKEITDYMGYREEVYLDMPHSSNSSNL